MINPLLIVWNSHFSSSHQSALLIDISAKLRHETAKWLYGLQTQSPADQYCGLLNIAKREKPNVKSKLKFTNQNETKLKTKIRSTKSTNLVQQKITKSTKTQDLSFYCWYTPFQSGSYIHDVWKSKCWISKTFFRKRSVVTK